MIHDPPRSYKRPTDEVARAIDAVSWASLDAQGHWKGWTPEEREAEKQRSRSIAASKMRARAALTRLREMGFLSDLAIDALKTKARSMEHDVRLSELTDDELAELARAVFDAALKPK
jgi:hypothetical protein